ncbi:MAG TPA: hypothetical protein VM290_11370 [Gaiellaceae bacterium]|nr:hypothetical protein [Gaiellaceae bacterium]
MRLKARWRAIAPEQRPPEFRPDDPGEPSYRWGALDRQVSLAVSRGLQPLVTVWSAPDWATPRGNALPGTLRPDPLEFHRFTRALVRRYSGTYEGLPRVRLWMAWNEPNLHLYLYPQVEGTTPVSPGLYRELVNQFAAAVRTVSGNVVIAGGTAPFRDLGVTNVAWGPLGFMRALLCVARTGARTCSSRIDFDVWSHHPYTSGGPRRKAALADDASLGDLAEVKALLQAAVRNGTIRSRQPVRFWVTEFSWDSSPPDPYGVPINLHARWVAEAIFRMWQNGVSLTTWLMLRDEPFPQHPLQSGLYFRGPTFAEDAPKPALSAFRFPFVAFPQHAKKRVFVWGRTPFGRAATVLVEQQFRGGWKRLGVVRTDRHGIFQTRFSTSRTGFVRARTLDRNERATPFSLANVRDRRFNPFGGAPLEP